MGCVVASVLVGFPLLIVKDLSPFRSAAGPAGRTGSTESHLRAT